MVSSSILPHCLLSRNQRPPGRGLESRGQGSSPLHGPSIWFCLPGFLGMRFASSLACRSGHILAGTRKAHVALPKPEQGETAVEAGSSVLAFLPPSHSGPDRRLYRALERCFARIPCLLPARCQTPGLPLHVPSRLCPGEGESLQNKRGRLRPEKTEKTSQVWLLTRPPKVPPAPGGRI